MTAARATLATARSRRGILCLLAAASACRNDLVDPARHADSRPSLAVGANGACVPLPPGAVAWWPGDVDGSELQAGHHGLLHNGATAGTTAQVGGGFGLDGVDDFIEAPSTPDLDIPGSITLIAWVNVTAFDPGSPSIINKGNVGNYDESYALFINPDRSAAILLNSGRYPGRGDLNRLVIGGGPLTAGVWHLIAGTFDLTSGAVDFYIDGLRHGFLPVWSDAQVTGGLQATTQPVLLGKAERVGTPYSTGYFNGKIDEAQIYSRALSQAEVQAIYNAGPAGICRDEPPPPPPPTSAPGGPYTGTEGSVVHFDGSGSDDPAAGGLTFAWDFGDGATGSGPTPTHAYADDGQHTVSLTVTAANGASSSASTTAAIANAAPVVGPITAPLAPQPVNGILTAVAPFEDPGALDTHSAVFDWDAAGVSVSSAGTISGTAGAGTVTGSHSYPAAGVFSIRVTVTDDDGDSGNALHQYIVVYDPSAGFVTGGGQIASPSGAFVAQPTLSGIAHFAFVSKYKKGATVPLGNTHFKFKTAGLEFASTDYEWLVVAGAKAQYKGSGTINGLGDYGFILTATDGALPGGGGVDRFRIKIWDKATEMIVYDNQIGDSDTANPAAAIQNGSIVIHK